MIGDPLELGQHRVEVDGAGGVTDEQDPVARRAECVRGPPVVRRTPAATTSCGYAGTGLSGLHRGSPWYTISAATPSRSISARRRSVSQAPRYPPGAQTPSVSITSRISGENLANSPSSSVPRVVLVHLGQVVVVLGLEVLGPHIRRRDACESPDTTINPSIAPPTTSYSGCWMVRPRPAPRAGTGRPQDSPAMSGAATVRVGVIGFGFGARVVAPVFEITEDFEVVDLVSPRDDDAVGELCARDDVDLISVHSPPFLHRDHVRRAIEGGHAVLCDNRSA